MWISYSVEELVPYLKNARRHPEVQVKALAEAIKTWGWTIPILVSEEGGVLAGHGRLEAAKYLGLEEVPCLVAKGWTEAQIRAYIIADNQLADASTWNSLKLREELEYISGGGWDLNLVGFDDAYLNMAGDADTPPVLPAYEDDFAVPRSSILNARGGAWQDRREAWMALGLKSELGRDDNLTFAKSVQSTAVLDAKASYEAMLGKKVSIVEFLEANPHVKPQSGTSIFDPVLCEAIYRWFCPEGGVVVDPFAGGSVRGVVAALLGFTYHGQDLREEQVVANRAQADKIVPGSRPAPRWVVGDSRHIKKTMKGVKADLVFSCPPYADLEVYSDDPNDLSTLGYAEFGKAYTEIIKASCSLLKEGGYAAFVVGEVRAGTGDYYGFVPDTIRAFEAAGMSFVSHAVLITCVNSLPTRAGKPFEATRKVGKTHQNILVFVKGDGSKAFKPAVKEWVFPVSHEPRKIGVSAAWLSKKFNCTLKHILAEDGCGGKCCNHPKFWPPRSGNNGLGPCDWLGPQGCTMAWDDKPVVCNLYPLVINDSDKIVLHHRSQFHTSVCKAACGSGEMLIDSTASGLISVFGKEQYDRVRADIVAGKDSYFIATPEIATAIDRDRIWEANCLPPEPMSKFAHNFTDEEKSK